MTMDKHVVLVRTPDGDRLFEPPGEDGTPISRPRSEAEAIAKQATDLAKRKGWRLSYYTRPA